jgi:beta-lactamase regulating signal transducer with metallopeptidase domain/HEAT repeat protein
MMHFIDAKLEPVLCFVADWSLRWAVLIGATALLLLLCRPRRVATRQLVCLATLVGGLLLPFVPRWGGGWVPWPGDRTSTPTLPTSEPQEDRMPAPFPLLARHAEGRGEEADRVSSVEPSHTQDEAPAKEEPWSLRRMALAVAVGCWSAGVLILLLRWGCGCWFLRRLRRTSVEMQGSAVEMFVACRDELDARNTVQLRAHPQIRSPVLLGVFRPLILVPLDWPQLPADVQRGALLHELAHVGRRDHWLAPLLHLLGIGFFFHPLVRWLLARLDYERELLCDEMVVHRGIDRCAYARILLEFARRSGQFALPGFSGGTYLPIGRRRTIKARIHHLLEESMERWIGPLPARKTVALCGVVLMMGLGVASYRVLAVGGEEAVAPVESEKQPAPENKKATEGAASNKAAAERIPPLKREALRYDGKNFDQWRTELVMELKPSIRADGMKALAAFGANGYGVEATQAILEIMRAYDVAIMHSAEEEAPVVKASLAAIPRIGVSSVPALIEAVKGDNRNARRFAIQALAELGTDARAVMPALLQVMKTGDVDTRCMAITAAVQIDPHAKGVVPALIQALQDAETADTAMLAVKKVGEEAKPATAALLAFLRDKDTDTQLQTIRALAAIGARKESAVEAGRLLRGKNEQARQEAFQFLQSLGVDAKPAVPALIAVLKDPEDRYRSWTLTVLGNIGPAAKEAIPTLNELLRANNTGMQEELRRALREIDR